MSFYVASELPPEEFEKDPDAIKWFGVDWSKWLVKENTTLVADSLVVTPQSPLTVDDTEQVAGKCRALFSGGVEGEKLEAEFKVVTADGQTEVRTIVINIRKF